MTLVLAAVVDAAVLVDVLNDALQWLNCVQRVHWRGYHRIHCQHRLNLNSEMNKKTKYTSQFDDPCKRVSLVQVSSHLAHSKVANRAQWSWMKLKVFLVDRRTRMTKLIDGGAVDGVNGVSTLGDGQLLNENAIDADGNAVTVQTDVAADDDGADGDVDVDADAGDVELLDDGQGK